MENNEVLRIPNLPAQLDSFLLCRRPNSQLSGMLASHALGFNEKGESTELLLEDPIVEINEEAELPQKVLYRASFEELARNYVQYNTIIWVMISLLLVLAWGVGHIMFLYLLIRRYVQRKDVASRKLYITPSEIVYKDETRVYKNLLQEISWRVGAPLLSYTTVRSGLGHLPVFACMVELVGITFTVEIAINKKQAEKNATWQHGLH